MLPEFGKKTLTIGSAPDCDIRLSGASVQPLHARIINESDTLWFENGNGESTCNGQPLAAGARVEVDFKNDVQAAHDVVGLLADRSASRGAERGLRWAGRLFVVGTVLFSGSLYLLVLTETPWLGAVTPLGGVAFIAGWIALAATAWRRAPHETA